MILYRLHATDGDNLSTEWFAHKANATQAAKKCPSLRWWLDRVEVYNDRDSMARALNAADMPRQWQLQGEQVDSSESHRGPRRRSATTSVSS